MGLVIEKNAKTVEEAVNLALVELQASRDEVEIEVLEENAGGFLGIGKSATVRVTKLDSTEADEEIFSETETAEEALDEANVELEVTETSSDEEVANVELTKADDEDDKDDDEEEANDTEEDTLSEEEKLAIASDAVKSFLTEILRSFDIDDVNRVEMEQEDGRLIARIQGDDCGILIGRKGLTLRAIQYLSSLVANKTTRSRVRFTLDIGAYKAKRKDSVADLAKRTAERAISTGQAFELTAMTAAERRIVHESLQDFEGITTYSEGDEPNRYVVIDLAYEDEEFSEEV